MNIDDGTLLMFDARDCGLVDFSSRDRGRVEIFPRDWGLLCLFFFSIPLFSNKVSRLNILNSMLSSISSFSALKLDKSFELFLLPGGTYIVSK